MGTREGRALLYLRLRRELEELQALGRGFRHLNSKELQELHAGMLVVDAKSKANEFHRMISDFDKSSLPGLARLLQTVERRHFDKWWKDKFSQLIEALPPDEIHEMIDNFDKFILPRFARLASKVQAPEVLGKSWEHTDNQVQAPDLLGELKFIQALHPDEFHTIYKNILDASSFPGVAGLLNSKHFYDITEMEFLYNVFFLLGATVEDDSPTQSTKEHWRKHEWFRKKEALQLTSDDIHMLLAGTSDSDCRSSIG